MPATNRVTAYSAKRVTLAIAGQLINAGYADGEFVTIEPVAEDVLVKKGADGETAIATSNNSDCNVKVKLLHTSLGNSILSALRLLGRATPQGVSVGTFLLLDGSSGVRIAHSEKAFIMKPPSPARGREITETEWAIYAIDCELDPSGSPSI